MKGFFYKNVVGGRAGVTEYYMYDATNLRLREVSLELQFPLREWMQKTKVLKNVQLSFVARNLCFLYKGSTFLTRIWYFLQEMIIKVSRCSECLLPRSLGFTLKCEF